MFVFFGLDHNTVCSMSRNKVRTPI